MTPITKSATIVNLQEVRRRMQRGARRTFGQLPATKLDEAQRCWGSARVVHGWRDAAFLCQHRGDLERRLVAKGLTPEQAQRCVMQRIAVLER